MSLALLPCEIYHREFDSKLLVAFELASKYNVSSLIGYDKYFNHLIPHFSPSVLLDKSCSSIVWQGRIKPLKSRGGSVLISDEEGFNNLTKYSKIIFSSRLDKVAARNVDVFSCWGKIDYEFWNKCPEISAKLKILGNPRSDLLGPLGRLMYEKEIQGLNSIFGEFVLASDNSRVEHIDKNYVQPRFSMTKQEEEENAALVSARRSRFGTGVQIREHYASVLEESAKAFPNQQFILRPHPTADPRWWLERLADLRNFHVIYHKSVDPWILSARCLLSTGCTTAIQAAIAGIPVIEVDKSDVNLTSNHHRYNSHLFADSFAKTGPDLINILSRIGQSPGNYTGACGDLLAECWHGSNTSSSYKVFANQIYQLLPDTDNSLNFQVLNKAYSHYKANPFPINEFKWPIALDFSEVSYRFIRIQELMPSSPPLSIQQVANNLYFISRKK